MSLLTVTVEVFNNQEPATPYDKSLSIPNIRLITSEDYDYFNDRGLIYYYNNQSMITEQYVVTETADALLTTIAATADTAQNTAMFSPKVLVNKIDRKPFGKLALINTDAKEGVLPETTIPAKVIYDFGNVNNAKHKELSVCAYPLQILSFDSSSLNSVTVNCCVANVIAAEASITIAGTPANDGTYTVVYSACATDGDSTVIVLEEALTNDLIGDPAGTVVLA